MNNRTPTDESPQRVEIQPRMVIGAEPAQDAPSLTDRLEATYAKYQATPEAALPPSKNAVVLVGVRPYRPIREAEIAQIGRFCDRHGVRAKVEGMACPGGDQLNILIYRDTL